MSLVCLDNHVLIWGIKEEASPGQEDMVRRAKSFLRYLDENSIEVLIPAVVVAEFLMPIPPEAHNAISNLLDKNFIIAPFDRLAATYFSKIWHEKHESSVIEELIANGRTKQELKFDNQIVAIAAARSVSCIYSHDLGVKKFAEGYISVSEIPFIEEQHPLF